MFKNKNEGLTLHQLLLILAAFGLLLVITALLLTNARRESRDSKRLADISIIRSALELHFHDCNFYPSQLEPNKPIKAPEKCGGHTYLSSVPADPKKKAYYYEPCTGSGTYNCPDTKGEASYYNLGYVMETRVAGVPKGRNIANPDKLFQ
jgi:Tfp pilus assembly protein PilE